MAKPIPPTLESCDELTGFADLDLNQLLARAISEDLIAEIKQAGAEIVGI